MGQSGRIILSFGLLTWASVAQGAEPVLKDGFQACVTDAVAASTPTIDCVTAAQASCEAMEEGSEDQLGCYLAAKVEWGEKLAALVDSFSDREVNVQELVRIEVKYAVIRNLNNCNLRMELGLVGREPEAADQTRRATCEAFGAAASLVEMLFKTGTIMR